MMIDFKYCGKCKEYVYRHLECSCINVRRDRYENITKKEKEMTVNADLDYEEGRSSTPRPLSYVVHHLGVIVYVTQSVSHALFWMNHHKYGSVQVWRLHRRLRTVYNPACTMAWVDHE